MVSLGTRPTVNGTDPLLEVHLFDYDGESGRLTPRQTLSTLPNDYAGSNFCSGIRVSKDGRFLYAGNRLHDSIGIFAIGTLAATRAVPFVPPAVDAVRTGAYTRNFEAHYETVFPTRSLGINLWAAVQYLLFHEGRRDVVVGTADWLYTTEEFRGWPEADASLSANLDQIAAIDRFAKANRLTRSACIRALAQGLSPASDDETITFDFQYPMSLVVSQSGLTTEQAAAPESMRYMPAVSVTRGRSVCGASCAPASARIAPVRMPGRATCRTRSRTSSARAFRRPS